MSNDEIWEYIGNLHLLLAYERLPEPWQQERARGFIRAFQSILNQRRKYEREHRRRHRWPQ